MFGRGGGATSSQTAGGTGGEGGADDGCPTGYLDGKPDVEGCTPVPGPGIKLWFAADDIPNDTKILLWSDRSGTGNDARQPESSLQPQRVVEDGLPRVRFDGGPYLTLQSGFSDLDEGYTMAAVVSRDAGAGELATIMEIKQATGDGLYFIRDGLTDRFLFGYSPTSFTKSQDAVYPAGVHLLMVASQDEDGSVHLRQCGQDVTLTQAMVSHPAATVHGSNAIGISRGNEVLHPHVGTISELLLFNRRLQGAELAALESYLVEKWEICP